MRGRISQSAAEALAILVLLTGALGGGATNVVGCSSTPEAEEPETKLPDRRLVDAADDAPSSTIEDSGSSVSKDADNNNTSDAGVDAGGGVLIPFSNFLVLRLEPDAPNGLQPDNVWRDLSAKKQAVTVASGTPKVEAVGNSGAKAMVFAATIGPMFDVADSDDVRFGATDDFFVVARASIDVPLGTGAGCSFHYLFSKYGTDSATGPQLRVCAPDTGRELIGSLKLSANDAKVQVPGTLTAFDVLSFGRNQSGKRIETRAGGASFEAQVNPLVDVSAAGKAFVIGGARIGTSVFGPYIGKVNRLYVYHAPAGTFANGDFDTIRAYVKDAAPLP